MKKGFTLLELMVVIIIIGVLSTLGVTNYRASIEKSRGAEARQVIGQLRSQCAAIYMGDGNTTNCTMGNLRIGANVDKIPNACRPTHFFSYSIPAHAGNTIRLSATRCIAGGKTPDASTPDILQLTIDYRLGTDLWTGTGGY